MDRSPGFDVGGSSPGGAGIEGETVSGKTEGARRLVSFMPTGQRGMVHAMAYLAVDVETDEQKDGVLLKEGPAWVQGRRLQWLSVAQARALADQLHESADAVEAGRGSRTPKLRFGVRP